MRLSDWEQRKLDEEYSKRLDAQERERKRRARTYRCVNGHDLCNQMYPGPDCPYCERSY